MSYAPAHEPHLTKHNNQLFEFDSPATIAKQQQLQQQPMVQAGGAPIGMFLFIINFASLFLFSFLSLSIRYSLPHTGLSAPPPPPALPQIGFRSSRPLNLRTRDWSGKPWNGQGNAYMPPTSLLQKSNSFSSGHFPVFIPSSYGHSSIASTTSSPRTPSLLGVYDPAILAGQTTHLKSSELPSASSSSISPSTSSTNIDSLHQGQQSGLQPSLQSAMQSGLQTGHSGLPSTSYTPSSTIPLSHNFHLPSSQLSQATFPANNLSSGLQPNGLSSGLQSNNLSSGLSSGLQPNNLSSGLSSGLQGSALPHAYPTSANPSFPTSSLAKSGIPAAPAFTGFRWGGWRSNRTRAPMRPLRTRNWGVRSKKGWSGFNSRNILDEAFLRNRPTFAPSAPAMRPMFAQRKWRSGPYRIRPLRTRNWGLRNESGWANFNRNLYLNEASLPLYVFFFFLLLLDCR